MGRKRTHEAVSGGLMVLVVPVVALVLFAVAAAEPLLIGIATVVTAGWVVAALAVTRIEPRDTIIDLRSPDPLSDTKSLDPNHPARERS